MIVKPFTKAPRVPRIALVNDDGEFVDEFGNTFNDGSEYKFRLGEIVCYVLWDTAVSLTKAGTGEILRWNNTEIRWRAQKYLDEDSWKSRALDAGIIRFPITPELGFESVLAQLIEFRDWLAEEGAKPHCSLGSTSMSLLKAKLKRELLTGRGAAPPIEFTRGGRTLMGREGRGQYDGQIIHWDLPAAYASALGNICYDGIWSVRPFNSALKAYENGAPVYCHATVDIPNVHFGPLPDYLSRPDNPIEKAFRNALGFPTGEKVEGIWILDELNVAAEIGCKIDPIQCWTNLTSRQPFLPWWNAIKQGRMLRGNIARSLAKRTGNALWGMFCSDHRAHSTKVILHYEHGKQRTRSCNFHPNHQAPGHDLAEAISGAVRAKLYQHIVVANSHLLCGHTDGLWVKGKYDAPEGWRIKQEARQLDLLDPQTMRYHIDSQHSYVIMSGVPPRVAPAKFEERWKRFQKNNSRKSDVPKVSKVNTNKGGILRGKAKRNLS